MSLATLPESDWIRGISIKQPYAACILAGTKTIENRPTRWRPGWVLLHASKTIDRRALRIPLIGRTIRGLQLVTGSVAGIARITDCHKDPDGQPPCSEWAHPVDLDEAAAVLVERVARWRSADLAVGEMTGGIGRLSGLSRWRPTGLG